MYISVYIYVYMYIIHIYTISINRPEKKGGFKTDWINARFLQPTTLVTNYHLWSTVFFNLFFFFEKHGFRFRFWLVALACKFQVSSFQPGSRAIARLQPGFQCPLPAFWFQTSVRTWSARFAISGFWFPARLSCDAQLQAGFRFTVSGFEIPTRWFTAWNLRLEADTRPLV